MVIHIVTDALPPTRGGLEVWTHNFARFMMEEGYTVIAYECGSNLSSIARNTTTYEICNLADLRSNWDKPLQFSSRPERINLEIWRLNFLLLRSEIRKRLVKHPDEPHLMVSNFAIGVGYLASLVSQDLSLAHLAMFVGTDFSRGFRNSIERTRIREVCENAYQVVCKSEEQAKSLRSAFALNRLSVIPTSVIHPSRRPEHGFSQLPIHLFSDCGLSYHKGTQVLLQSVLTLLSEGLPVRLTLCGAAAITETEYWDRYTVEVIQKSRGAIGFLGYVAQDNVQGLLLNASIYCSATLGEGSSAGRLTALCSGIPVVTTRCGEFLYEVEEGVSHIFLSDPGDAQAYTDCLRDATNCLLRGKLNIDWAVIQGWRERFSRDREFLLWSTLLKELLNNI